MRMRKTRPRMSDILVDLYAPDGYRDLCGKLNEIPFHSDIRDDDNRIDDAIYFREEMLDEYVDEPPSVLLVLVALLDRMSLMLGEEYSVKDLLEECISNADLGWYSDDHTEKLPTWVNRVEDEVERVLNRDVDANGWFPTQEYFGNQKKMSLWKQMNNYIMDGMIADIW